MDLPPIYAFAGVGVCLSVIGFFLKKVKTEVEELKWQHREDQVLIARLEERVEEMRKVLEDRRHDIKKIFERIA